MSLHTLNPKLWAMVPPRVVDLSGEGVIGPSVALEKVWRGLEEEVVVDKAAEDDEMPLLLGPGEPPKVLEGEEGGDRGYRGGVMYPPAVAWESTFGASPRSWRCIGLRGRSEKSGSGRRRRYVDSPMLYKRTIRRVFKMYPPRHMISSHTGCLSG